MPTISPAYSSCLMASTSTAATWSPGYAKPLDGLAAGAADAARQARSKVEAKHGDPCLSILISCIGRRLLMGQRTIEEIEAVGAELGSDMVRLGFYSYGEISPHVTSGLCELHNQTMTITALAEAA
jgi:hypothetical protein